MKKKARKTRMKNLGQMEIENVFIRGTERKQGVTKVGKDYDFTLVRFDDETGEGFELRLDDEIDANVFTRRSEGVLIVNVYHGKFKGQDLTYLKAAGFKKYED